MQTRSRQGTRSTDTWCLATHNAGKLKEFRSLIEPRGYRILSLDDLGLGRELQETGSSFAENARLKALHYSHDTDLPVLGDDSGLEVVALEGRPGLHSARYAGPHATNAERIAKVLQELRTAGGSRGARFICALALVRRGAVLAEAEGTCGGTILEAPRGTQGFGYDPIFLFPDLGKTFAELDEARKNLHSHRGQAVRTLLARLKS